MKILFLTDGLSPYNTGGMQKHSYILSKLLAQNNCQITLVHSGFNEKIEFNEDYSAIFSKDEFLNITPIFIPFIKSKNIPGHYVTDSKAYSKEIENFFGINLSKFDLIYAQGFTAWAFTNNIHKVPVLANLHGFEMFQKYL